MLLKEAVQRDSTISGGLYFAERCCQSRVLERESRIPVLTDAAQNESRIYFDVSGLLFKKCSRNFIMKIESPLRRKSSVKNVLQI